MYIDLLKEKEKIESLAEIKSIGFKIIEDEHCERTSLILQDIEGETYEFPLYHSNMDSPEDYWIRYTKAVVVNFALEKSFGKEWYRMPNVCVASDDLADVIKAINKARKLKPVEQSGCINKEKIQFYEHICPIFII